MIPDHMTMLSTLALPGYVPPAPGEVNRATASEINRLENTRQTEMYSGAGEVIPVVYGEQEVAGPRLVDPWLTGNSYSFAIAISQGPIEAITHARVKGGAWTALNQNNTGTLAPPGTGVVIRTRYMGTQTTPDTWLAGRITGYNAVYPGVAYVVVEYQIQAGDTSLPDVEFRVRGRRVVDPRTGITTWTENPALHLHDFATNTEWGLGRQVRGAEAAADACDSLYSGLPRSRTGVAFQTDSRESEVLKLLGSYAEVLSGYDGDTITLIPDVPITGPAPLIAADQIIGGTLTIVGEDAIQMPTQVSVIFTDRSESGDWTTRPAVAALPIDALQGTSASRSEVRLPGVYRRSEAERRAHQRLLRLQTPVKISWQMWDLGVQYEPGDVVRLPDIRGLRGVEVRITAQPELIGVGKYQLEGEIYSSSMYPSDGGGTSVPVGAIVPYLGALPAGYAVWARGGHLIGDATGGTLLPATAGTLSLSFASAGGHVGERESTDKAGSGAGTGTGIFLTSGSPDVERGAHPHTASVSYSNLLATAGMEQMTFAKRTGSAAPLTSGIGFLAAEAINAQRITAVMSVVGRYLAAGATRLSRARRQSVEGETSEDGEHDHGSNLFELGAGTGTLTLWTTGGNHRHPWSANISARLRSRRMALYQASDEALLPPGAVVGWEDGTPPAGWRTCDGTGGTVDLRGFFIELCAPDDAGTIASTVSQIALTGVGTTPAGPHNHRRVVNNANIVPFGSSGRHSLRLEMHAHDGQDRTLNDLLPERRTLQFIQYMGPPEPEPPVEEVSTSNPDSPPQAGFFA